MEPKADGHVTDPLVDSVIANRYKIISRIARGGMATVYLASDQALNRQVAIKVLEPPKATDDPARLLERFRREAEALAQLNHRHIVTIFDYGPTEYGGYFLVMEYVAGESLAQVLKSGELDPDRAVRLMAQIGRALRYAHRKGIVHRDLKPGNILLGREDEEDVAKLVDFGLVKTDEEALTHHGLILGSVHCMAPEQIRGRGIDQRTDIYAFGCCLYRLVVGQYPFPSKVSTEVLAAHIHAPVPSFAEGGGADRVSPEVEQVVLKCLAKEPEARYQTIHEVLEALGDATRLPTEDASASIAHSGSHAPLEEAVQKPAAVPWVWLGAAAAAAVLVLGVGAVGLAVMGSGLGGDGAQGAVAAAATADGSAEATPPAEPVAQEAPVEATGSDDGVAETTAGADAAGAAASGSEGTVAAEPEPPPKPAEAAPKPAKPPPAKTTASRSPPKPPPADAPPAEAPPTQATATSAPPKVEGTAAAEPAAAVMLQSVDVDASSGIRITLQMSNASVRPLHFLMEGASDEYPMQYVVEFKGGASEVGQKIAVGSPLVDSITMSAKKGKLRIAVNSKQPVDFKFDGSGSTWTIVVSAR